MKRRIFGIGETVLDIIIKEMKPIAAKAGGSVLNALISLARCGHEVYFISEVGADKTGDLIIDFLKSNKINTNYITRFKDGQTTIAMGFLNENNDAEYQFYKQYPPKRHLNIPTDFCQDDLILFGSFYSINPEIRGQVQGIVQLAKDLGSYIVYDPNFRKQHQLHEDIVNAVITNMQMANLLRASNEDVSNLFEISSVSEGLKKLSTYCENIVITENSKGVNLQTKHYNNNYKVPIIQPISTIGAGDNFNAGMLDKLVHVDNLSLNLTAKNWDEIIQNGIDFSKEVCLTYDNYVSNEFADKRRT